MRHKKTAAELKGEINKIGQEIKAMDEHSAKSLLDGTMDDRQLEVHRKSRNRLVTQSNIKLKLMKSRP